MIKCFDIMIDKNLIIRMDNLPIEQVAERLGLNINKHKCLCPFHDDRHPSLSFNATKNKYRCWSCGAHGGTIDLVMSYLSCGFVEACNWLALEGNYVLENHQRKIKEMKREEPKIFDASRYERYFLAPRLSDKASHFLVSERRISPYVISYSRVNTWISRKTGTEWLSIPYYGINGRLIGVQHRNLDFIKDADNKDVKFRFPAGSQCHTYNLPILQMVPPNGHLWIAEGCTDCWALLSMGRHTLAIPSATTLKYDDILLIKKFKEHKNFSIHIAPDADEPGENLYLLLKQYFPDIIRHQLPHGYKDFSQWWAAQ